MTDLGLFGDQVALFELEAPVRSATDPTRLPAYWKCQICDDPAPNPIPGGVGWMALRSPGRPLVLTCPECASP